MRRETNITATKTKYTNEEIEYEISYLTASMPCEQISKITTRCSSNVCSKYGDLWILFFVMEVKV